MRIVNWRDLKSMFILPCGIAHTRRSKAIRSCLGKETFLNKRVTAKEYTQCSLSLTDTTPFNDWVWFSYVKTQTETQMKIYKLICRDTYVQIYIQWKKTIKTKYRPIFVFIISESIKSIFFFFFTDLYSKAYSKYTSKDYIS